ncbi:MAG: hypothetical protein ACYSWU_02165 [Planctomycetota bacterium]|jgi:hypothetical protein
MSVANVINELNQSNSAGIATVADYGDQGIKSDLIAESTSGSGTTLSGATIRTGGDKTAMIAITDADYTVLAANSGKIHLVANVSADRTFTLPTAAAGLYYEFWSTVIAADGHDWIIDTGADANFFLGGLLWTVTAGDATAVVGDGDSNSILGIRVPDACTWIKMYCNGTNWYLAGHVLSATTPDFADQS